MFGVSTVEGRICFFFAVPLLLDGRAVFPPRDLVLVGRDALVSLLSDTQPSSTESEGERWTSSMAA